MGKGGGGSAPKPDPQIGQAALENAALGREYLDFAKIQHGDAMIRQGGLDKLTEEVIRQDMGISAKQLGLSERQLALAEQTAAFQMEIARKQQALAEKAAEKQFAMSDKQLEIATQQQEWAVADRDRYENVFLPVEDEFIDRATSYDSEERQAEVAAEARADVQRQADVGRQQTQRQMSAMGLNPNSGRFAGIDRAAEMEAALAGAGAANMARNQVRDKGLALKADVANMGRGLPAQSAQAASIGLGAGQASVGSAGAAVGTIGAASGALNGIGAGYGQASGTLGAASATLGSALGAAGMANQNFFNSQGIMGAGFNQAMQGVSNQANILNQQYNSQLNAWSMQQQADAANSAGIFGAIGTGIGLAFSSKDFKEDRKPAKGALDKINKLQIDNYKYKEGIADEGKHVGPMAEDFQRVTGVGDGKTIAHQDSIGLTMKAVQELDEKVDKISKQVGVSKKAGKTKPQKREDA